MSTQDSSSGDVPISPEVVTTSTVPPAASLAGNSDTTPKAPLLAQEQGSIVLNEATLKDLLTECIKTGLREAKAESTNNWAEINSALKDVDDEKIVSCKEDIDTLLVFAGLFSAALTAFVVESYQRLSPDPTDQIIQLLTRIAVQTNGYTVSESHANATMSGPGTIEPTFEPSPCDVLVNRLWFASLVLTLITTSFGILIKQWLREYRAVDPQHSNIRSRLRIRQFRYPGLLRWRVFEFAAFLPLLIQLALGLFLLGLCAFTWTINPSIGQTLTVLVAAWIFFFVAFAFAPAASSACPYKISLFSPIYPTLRSWTTSLWCLDWTYLGPRQRKLRLLWSEVVAWYYIAHIPSICFRYIRSAMAGLLGMRGHKRADVGFRELSWRYVRKGLPDVRPSPLEEMDIVEVSSKDLDVVSDADNLLLDEELLSTTMHGLIVRDQFRPQDITRFVRSISEHRLPQPTGLCNLINLTPLSSRVADAALDMLSVAIRDHMPQSPASLQSSVWAQDALTILTSLLLRGTCISDDLDGRVLAVSSASHFSEVPGLPPGILTTVLLRDLVSSLQHYFPKNCLDPSFIRRIYGARYCTLDCQHTSITEQLHQHHWKSQDDHGVVLRLTQDALDESLKRWMVSEELEELLWATSRPADPYFGDNSIDVVGQDYLGRHLISVLRDAPWSFVKSFATNACTPVAHSQLLYRIIRDPFVESGPSGSIVPLNDDHLVSIRRSTRFLRLLIFALVRYREDKGHSDEKHRPDYSDATWSTLWNSFSVPMTSSSFHFEEINAALYLWAEFGTKLHYDGDKLESPPSASASDLSVAQERHATAAVEMIMQMFESASGDEEPGPVTLADLEAWSSSEAA